MAGQGQGANLSPLQHEQPHKIKLAATNTLGAPTDPAGLPSERDAEAGDVPPFEVGGSPADAKKKRIRLRHGVKIPMYGEISWGQLWQWTKTFMKDPLNVALVIWLLLSGVGTVLLCLLELGFLDKYFESKEKREEWADITTQILNALCVLMNAVFHPVFIRHSYMLYRWTPKDKKELREYYCRGGHRKPRDQLHMMNLVILLHIMCISMYALAIIYWAYPRGERPLSAVWITLVAATISPGVAFLYAIMSPLQRDYNEVGSSSSMEDGQIVFRERKLVFALDGKVVEHPQWQGSVCPGCFAKRRTALLTCLLPFVMFGLHMHRLGFGNKYIQTSTFLLVIVGPLLLFELAAQTVKDGDTRQLVAVMGLVVAELGLVYGAVWRSHMRKAFRLPASRWVCGNAKLTDCALWLLCPYCTLCQEVRTSQYYQIVEEGETGLYINPEEMLDGGAEMEESAMGSSVDSNFESGDNPMNPPEVLQGPIRGSPGKNGFVRL